MSTAASAVHALRGFLAPAVERCDFCRARVADAHDHLVEAETLRLLCACEACALDFADPALGYRRVEPGQRVLKDFVLDDRDWAALGIPIDVAFLFRPEEGAAPVALFPGPAGATRSQLSAEVWSDLARRYPLLAELEPAAEALLVNRCGGRRDHYQVSTDRCYALAGVLRTHWRGLAGGPDAWSAIDRFFADLDASSGGGAGHA